MFNYISLILSFSLINGFTAAIPQKETISKPIFAGYFIANNNSISNLNYLSFESETVARPIFSTLLVPKSVSTKASSSLDTKPRVMLRLKNFEKKLEQQILEEQKIEQQRLEQELQQQQILEQERLDDIAQTLKLLKAKKVQAAIKAKPSISAKQIRQAMPVINPVSAPVNLAPASPTDFESFIIAQCNNYGCNSAQLIRVMYCESGGRSGAKNPSGASGLFQFMPATFRANSQKVGIAGANIWDPYQQIQVAAWMFANGQSRQWVCK